MNKVIHFQTKTRKKIPEKSPSFYSNVFGWKASKWDGPMDYWLVLLGPEDEAGIDGAFMLRNETDKRLEKSALITIEVSSVDESLKKIKDNRGRE